MPCRLLILDNQSTDGSREICDRYADRLISIPEGHYIPGRVLNQGLQETDGSIVVFLNSDCPPLNANWLEKLILPFENPKVGATFGCQAPRRDCWPLFAKDTNDTFGNGERQKFWRHCFSMASSAVRRSAWEATAFSETLKYSEDIDWSWRIRQQGHEIVYAADSIVEHSHNYTLKQFHKRQFGEGKADAAIFEWNKWDASFLRYSLLPFFRQVLSDERYAVKHLSLSAALHSPALRLAQLMGRRKGFVEGLMERSEFSRTESVRK